MKILFFLLATLVSLNTFGCSCLGKRSDSVSRYDIKESDLIVIGTILSCDTIYLQDTLGFNKIVGRYEQFRALRLKYRVKVSSYLKCRSSFTRDIEIVTGIGRADCGYLFATGKQYIIYARTKNKLALIEPVRALFNYTTTCTPTALYSAESFAYLMRFRKLRKTFNRSVKFLK